ncbi:MAG: GGDEF domain-containing protein [Agarilytica sp.]
MGTLENNNDNTRPAACPTGNIDCPVSETLTALHHEIASLKTQVSTDPLTGLSNVAYLKQSLEREMECTRRNQQPTTFCIIDADHFKLINDTYGHVVGDKALIHLASTIKKVVRKMDIACRYGGEEFAVILPTTPFLVGVQVAERVRQSVESTPLILDEQTISITVSIGIETFTHHSSDTIESFIARADTHLYQAKHSGRNQVSYTTEHATSKAEVSQSEKDALFNLTEEDE